MTIDLQRLRSDVFHVTNALRFERRTVLLTADTATHRFVLQQAWQGETGEVMWQDVPTVDAPPASGCGGEP